MMGNFLGQININTLIIAIGAIFIAINSVRSSKFQDYKDAISGKDLKIAQLEADIATNKAKFEADLATLKAKSESAIVALQIEIQHLKESNLVLQNTVTGKEVLTAIQQTLAPVPGFFASGGTLDTFVANDKLILSQLEDIKSHLKITNRIRDKKDHP